MSGLSAQLYPTFQRPRRPCTTAEFGSCVKVEGGRPGFSVLMSLTVSVDVKQH